MHQDFYGRQQKDYHGFYRTNFIKGMATMNPDIIHRFIPTGIGKLCSYREKVQAVLGENYLFYRHSRTGRLQMSPLFKFAIEAFILFQAMDNFTK